MMTMKEEQCFFVVRIAVSSKDDKKFWVMSKAMSHECDIIMGFSAHWGGGDGRGFFYKVFYN